MEFKDYYHILGVSKTASQDEIQKAYRKLARKHHPDVSKSADAEAQFKEIGEAYDVLKDPEKRSKYDRYGAAWKAAEAGHQAPPGFDGMRFEFGGNTGAQGDTFFDILENLFGNMGQASRRGFGGFGNGGRSVWETRGEDFEAKLSLALEEAAAGGRRTLSLADPKTGQRRSYSVNIPKGVVSGQRIRLAGQGGPGSGPGPAGDLFLVVDVEKHPDFDLQGRDLYTVLDIAPWQAALGAKVTMETLSGRVRVTVPPHSSSGRKIRLKGHGFPAADGTGDLYAEIRIVVLARLSAKERQLYQQLADLDKKTAVS